MTLTFTITRDEGLWVATAPGIIGGLTSTRLAQLKRDIELVASKVFPDRADEALEIAYVYELPGAYETYKRARSERQAAETRYAQAQAAAVRELTAEGISQREAAELLELSKQRVHQVQHS